MEKSMLKVRCSDMGKVLNIALCSCAQRRKNDCIYLWYYSKKDAQGDKSDLLSQGIESELMKGWENDGFTTFVIEL